MLAPGGRIALFCPNRLYPFETHGHYWRGQYHFGNTPLINWLPNPLRNRLAPHVRAYTGAGLRGLFAGQPVRVVHHSVVYPGFDNVSRGGRGLGRILRRVLYALEHTPLQVFGLSHFLVLEQAARLTSFCQSALFLLTYLGLGGCTLPPAVFSYQWRSARGNL